MAEMAKVITSLEQNKESYNLGATFNNIFLSEEDDFSLKDLYEHYNKVLENCDFISYEPDEPENINVWYHLFPDAFRYSWYWDPFPMYDPSSWTVLLPAELTKDKKEFIFETPSHVKFKKDFFQLEGRFYINGIYNNEIITNSIVKITNIPIIWLSSNTFLITNQNIIKLYQNNGWTNVSLVGDTADGLIDDVINGNISWVPKS